MDLGRKPTFLCLTGIPTASQQWEVRCLPEMGRSDPDPAQLAVDCTSCHRQRAYPGYPWWSRAHRVSVTRSQSGASSWAVLPSLISDGMVGVWWKVGGHVALHSRCWLLLLGSSWPPPSCPCRQWCGSGQGARNQKAT